MDRIIEFGKKTLEIEIECLKQTALKLDDNFVKAVEIILTCKGRVIVTGMGKSGHIGQKIAATFSSTGTPSFFMHPAEGVHGDLGMIVQGDVIIAISYSGETDEIKKILPLIKRFDLPLISITGNINSTLGQVGDAVLDASIIREACPMNLAPTSSTTVAMALGDALAVALVEQREFKKEDFAKFHPSGSLGKKLLLKVNDIMHTDSELPIVTVETTFKDLLYIISSKGFGCAIVLDNQKKIIGIVTDGDIRKGMEKMEVSEISVSKLMSADPKLIDANALAAEAMAMMEKYKITSIVVVDNENNLTGLLHMHDLIKTGLC